MGRARGVCVWLTGLSGSGKTTIAQALRAELEARGEVACVLDGDVLREGLCADLGFDLASRAENVRRAGEVAKLLMDSGVVVICALISPQRAGREAVRERLGAERFVECYVSCALEICEARDVKGLYRRARAEEIADFTGISSVYEEPISPQLVLRTELSNVTAEACAARILAHLDARWGH